MGFSLFGSASVYTETIIPASPEEVWAVLTDVEEIRKWNPVLVPIVGQLQEGEKLKYRMIQPGAKESVVTAKVIKMVLNQLLNQYGGVPGVLTFNHKWILEPVEGGTKIIQREEYKGIGVWFWDYSWVETAYSNANEALRNRIVSLQTNSWRI